MLSVRRALRGAASSTSKKANVQLKHTTHLHHQSSGAPTALPAPLPISPATTSGRSTVRPTVQCLAVHHESSLPPFPERTPPVHGAASTILEISSDVLRWDLSATAPSAAPKQHRTRRRRKAAARAASVDSHEIHLSDGSLTPPPSPRHTPANRPSPTSPAATPAPRRHLNTRPLTSLLPAILLLLSLTVITVHLPHLLLPTPRLPSLPQSPSNPLAPILSLASALNPSPSAPTPPPSPPTSSPYPIPPPSFLDAPVRVAAIIPRSAPSPFQDTPWGEVMAHLATRLSWTDPSYSLHIVHEDALMKPGPNRDSATIALRSAQIVLGANVHEAGATTFLQDFLSLRGEASTEGDGGQKGQTVFFLDSDQSLMRMRRLGGEEWVEGAESSPLDQLLPWRKAARARKQEVVSIMEDLWHRRSSEDLLFAFLVLIHEYVTPVPSVASSANGMDLQSLLCIVRYCASDVVRCVNDPACKQSLDCLQSCAFNDQVCQYRCIVSYETPALGQFSLCILQLHNCRRLDATPPALPDPTPMPSFQGAPITHEAAEKVLRGWLGEKPASWLVAAGKNPAYDYFPCQHQLFFPGKARGAYWYEPVFKVKTLDNREVWRRRRYRVRRGKAPGTFHFTVLDNGVTSKEFWRLMDAADDMSFSLFYYSGAASAAGLSYSGAVLATPDGRWPAPEYLPRIEAALDRAGIKMWELSNVDNSACDGAPLELSAEAVEGLARAAAA